MTEQAWLKEGDVIISRIQMKYFRDLVDYLNEKGLKEDFINWQKQQENIKMTKKYDKKLNGGHFLYHLEKEGVKGFYTRDEIYTALEIAIKESDNKSDE